MSVLRIPRQAIAALCIDLGTILLRPALVWGHCAASCIALGSVCGALRQFCVTLLRSASLWGQNDPAAACLGFMEICCVLHRFGVILLRSASIWGHSAAFCIDLGVHSLANEPLLYRMSALSSDCAHSLHSEVSAIHAGIYLLRYCVSWA